MCVDAAYHINISKASTDKKQSHADMKSKWSWV